MTYKVELTHTDEGYSVSCPELPGCRSEGENEEEALKNIREAISEYLVSPRKADVAKQIRFVEVHPQTKGQVPDLHPFTVTPIMSKLPPEWTSHKVDDLLDILEGPDRRW